MKILFVCTGNTCRSCMAEAIFNKLNTLDNTQAFSAGIAVIPGSRTSKNSALIIKEKLNLDISTREAVQLTRDMLEEYDLILTMTTNIKNLLISNFDKYSNKIYAINEFIKEDNEVIDPYGGNIDIYNNTFEQLKKYNLLLLAKLMEDKGIN